VLCGEAADLIAHSSVKELVVTDSIPHAPGSLPKEIRVLSVAPLLAEAIRRIHDEESLSSLFI
jgi:ribose-phosphate pyrophosphokinase